MALIGVYQLYNYPERSDPFLTVELSLFLRGEFLDHALNVKIYDEGTVVEREINSVSDIFKIIYREFGIIINKTDREEIMAGIDESMNLDRKAQPFNFYELNAEVS